MKLIISQEVLQKFPSLHVGVVVAKNMNNTGESAEVLEQLKQQVEAVRQKYEQEKLPELPHLAAWRQAYSAFGAKPKKYTCSVENLYRMVLEGIDLRHINTLVDIYNVISLKHCMPVGGDDTDHIDGNITLRFATGQEPFIRLNSDEVDHPKPGEVIYADDKEVLCRRWNWRECDKSKMTEQTTNAALVVEGLGPVTGEQVKAATDELAQMVEKYCGGQTQTYLLGTEISETLLT